MTKFVLASASKPRAQILHQMGLHFTQQATMVAENLDPELYPTKEAYCDATSRLKCDSIQPTDNETVYITADTIVIVGEGTKEEMLEKPANYEDAKRMLMLYVEYKQARVYTSVCVRKGNSILQRGRTTIVHFRDNLSSADIDSFLTTHYSTVCKGCGALVVLGPSCLLIDEIQGCYLNSAGLSPAVLLDLLHCIHH